MRRFYPSLRLRVCRSLSVCYTACLPVRRLASQSVSQPGRLGGWQCLDNSNRRKSNTELMETARRLLSGGTEQSVGRDREYPSNSRIYVYAVWVSIPKPRGPAERRMTSFIGKRTSPLWMPPPRRANQAFSPTDAPTVVQVDGPSDDTADARTPVGHGHYNNRGLTYIHISSPACLPA